MNNNPVVAAAVVAVVAVVAVAAAAAAAAAVVVVAAAGYSSTETVLGTSLPGLDMSYVVQVVVAAAADVFYTQAEIF
jgi:cell wall-associated NlpC family hydrolase